MRGGAGAGAGGADAGGDHEEDAEDGDEARSLPEHDEASQQRDGRLDAHQRAEGAGGDPAQGEELQAEREREAERGQPEHGERQRPGKAARQRGAGDRQRDGPGDGDRDRQPVQAADPVADVLGEQDVAGPAHCGDEGEAEAGEVDAAVPGLGQQHDADRAGDRPEPAHAGLAVDRHPERPHELQRRGRAERQPGDGQHEREHQDGGHHAEPGAGEQVPAGEVTAARADRHQQHYPAEGEPQRRRPARAELAEQGNGESQAQLDGADGGDRHQGAAARAVQAAGGRTGGWLGEAHEPSTAARHCSCPQA